MVHLFTILHLLLTILARPACNSIVKYETRKDCEHVREACFENSTTRIFLNLAKLTLFYMSQKL